MDQLIQYSVLATGTAALYTLLAHCILIVHRGSRILNFATGAYVMFGAYLFHYLRENDWALWPAAVATVLAIGAIGGLTYLVVVRPLRDASLVSRIVATLAVVIILAELANLWQPQGGLVEAVMPEHTVDLFGTSVGVDRLILLGIAAGASIVLWALYKFTTLGIATAAVSENTRAASALGWSADRIAFTSWFLAGVVAGLSGVLISPVQSALDTSNLTLNVVPALAVALIAKFRSFPIALVAAIALASIQAYLNGAVVGDNPGWKGVDAIVPLLAIIIVLALQGDRIPPRGARSERRPMLGTGIVRPVAIVVGVGLAMLAIWMLPTDWVRAISLHATYALLVLSLVVVLGYAGQLSLGQIAFAGIGALITGRLVATQDWSFGLAVLVGVLGAAFAGAVFALPALRTRGVALGIVTLGLGAAVYSFLFTRTYYSPAAEAAPGAPDLSFGVSPEGTVVKDLKFLGVELGQFEHPETYATMCVIVLALVSLVVVTMRRSRAGRRLIAIRTNERAAASLGISVPAAKLYAFSLSAAIAALAGILLAFRNHVITYDNDYSPLQSIYAVAFSVIGGVGSVVGAVFGALLFPGTIGAAMGHDTSEWLKHISEPPPWITAQIVGGIAFAIAKPFVKSGKALLGIVVAGVVAGVVLDDAIGSLLGEINDQVSLVPWLGALILGAIAAAVAGAITKRAKWPARVPLVVFVVATVLARLFADEKVGGWLTNSARYLPLLGGVALIDMMLRHGDGLAITVSHAVSSARHKVTQQPLAITDIAASTEAAAHATPNRSGGQLEIRGMSVTFGGVRAVDDLDLVLHPGEILGLIGPNGAGKSTVVDAITGYARLSSGQILLDGESITGLPAHQRARKGIARTFQNLELFDDITVLENLAAASDTHEVSAYLTGLVYAGKPHLSPMAINALQAFALEDDLDDRANTLPHGRRRLVAVARAVANNPKVLLLDEPAAGLDAAERVELATVVRTLASKYGIAVMVIEHDMAFIMSLCDRVAVIDFGRKIADGSPADVQASPEVIAAYLGAADEEAAAHAAEGAAEIDPETVNAAATGDLAVLTEERP